MDESDIYPDERPSPVGVVDETTATGGGSVLESSGPSRRLGADGSATRTARGSD